MNGHRLNFLDTFAHRKWRLKKAGDAGAPKPRGFVWECMQREREAGGYHKPSHRPVTFGKDGPGDRRLRVDLLAEYTGGLVALPAREGLDRFHLRLDRASAQIEEFPRWDQDREARGAQDREAWVKAHDVRIASAKTIKPRGHVYSVD